DEVEGRAPLHLERRTRVMGEDEDRGVEGRLLAPPAAPTVVGPRAGLRSELAAAHDLRADRPVDARGDEGIVDAPVRGQVDPVDPATEPRRAEPVEKSGPGMTEGGVEGLVRPGGEAVERDGEVVDAGE